jgi:hypothetical protein
MNRKERRAMSKRLGIMAYQQKLPRDKKFNIIHENIISGKLMHEEFIEKSRIMQEKYADEVESIKLYNLASQIAHQEKIPLVDAFEKAQEQINEERKKQ